MKNGKIRELPEDVRLAVAEAARTAGNSSTGRSAYAEIITRVVEPNHLTLDLFSDFMPTRTMKPGDILARRVQRGRYPVRTFVPGTKHWTDKTDYVDTQNLSFDRLVVGASANLWEIQQGDVLSVEGMRTALRQDLFDELVSKVFGLLSTVWNATDTPSNYVDASATGVTEAGLETLIENMIDVVGDVRLIMGSRKALLPLYDFAQYREFVLTGTGTDRAAFTTPAFDEFNRTGRVSTYRGIRIVEMPQVYRNRFIPGATGTLRSAEQRMIPTDKIILLGGNAGEIVLYDEFKYQDYTDMTTQPPNYVLHGWQGWTTVIDDVEQIGIIKTNT